MKDFDYLQGKLSIINKMKLIFSQLMISFIYSLITCFHYLNLRLIFD